MYNGPIAPGTGASLNGKKPSLRSSEETQFLYLVLKSIQNLSGIVSDSAMGPAVVNFTVDDGTGAPVSGGDTWIISTLNVIHKSPTFTLNGVIQKEGTDYTFNNTTAKVQLLSGLFLAHDVWTVIY